MLFEAAQQHFARDTEAFHNTKRTTVEVTIEGVPIQLYSQGLRPHQMWDEVRKYFAAGSKRHPDISAAAKDMALADVRLGGFLTNKYALWLDLRTTDDDQLHGIGRRISEGMTIQIQKEAYEHRRLLDMRRRPRYPRWPIRPSSLLTTSCRGRRIRRSYVGR